MPLDFSWRQVSLCASHEPLDPYNVSQLHLVLYHTDAPLSSDAPVFSMGQQNLIKHEVYASLPAGAERLGKKRFVVPFSGSNPRPAHIEQRRALTAYGNDDWTFPAALWECFWISVLSESTWAEASMQRKFVLRVLQLATRSSKNYVRKRTE